MLAFFVHRLGQALVVMFVISLLSFSIQDNLGDPLRELVGQSVSEAERQQLREAMGLNDPFVNQYGRFLKKALQGDLGDSYFFKRPALGVILEKLPATLELVLGATLIILLLSVPVGVYCAINPRSWFSKLMMGVSIVGISIPVFLTAIMLIYLFSIHLGWLPSFGRGETLLIWGGYETGLLTADGLRHLLLPSIALSSIMLPLFIRLIRSEMMEVLEQEYIRFAWAKGLKRQRIWFLHALKNTLLPVITVGG
ncbi:MAG: ABC transporter permease, partial [Gammaproteobacteria bacterium]|nr:ABC transporter permease [Gammaproteobacteria bacterium]